MTVLRDLVHILHTRITLQVSVLRYNIKVDSSYLINHSPCQKCRGGCVEDIATKYKPARRVRFTLGYVKAHEDLEDGALLKEA